MMKTLCVAVVVLSLTSVCQPASLACEELLKPVDKGPDLSGSWYAIAVSSDNCFITSVIKVLAFSAGVNVTSKDIPNIYDLKFKFKIYGYCATESETIFYNNTISDVDSNNAPKGEPDVLLQSGCPDCIAVKGNDLDINTLILLSRRENVTADELKEFETQAECLGWSKPLVLLADHDHVNCSSIDSMDTDDSRLLQMVIQRLQTTYAELIKCVAESLGFTNSPVFEWVQQLW